MILPSFMFVKKNLNRKKEKKGCVTIGEALFYYKLRQTLLQIRAASYYKLRQLLQIRATIITKQGSYYKLGENLSKIGAGITN